MSFELLDSAYQRMRQYLNSLGGTSADFIPMSMGYPEPGEFLLPSNVIKALSVTMEDGCEKPRPGYGWPSRATELKENLVYLENTLHRTNYSTDNICLVAGATYAFNRICEQLFLSTHLNNKNILIVAPTYFWMHNQLKYYAQVKTVVGSEQNDFQITPEEILNSIDGDTIAVFIANPSNPTCLYYSDDFFNELVPQLENKNIYLIIDESGDAFNVATGKERLRPFPSILDNPYVIRLVTASKKYLLAEYRIGYVLATGLLPALKLGSYKVRKSALDDFLLQHEGQDLTNPRNISTITVEENA